jgi:hypothetical protein
MCLFLREQMAIRGIGMDQGCSGFLRDGESISNEALLY